MKFVNRIVLSSILISSTVTVIAQDSKSESWFVRPTISLSNLSDTSAELLATPDAVASVDVNTDSGFATGIGIGYQYNPNIAVELYWEYRTNDSDSQLLDNTIYGGNYASNIFYLNGFYFFDSDSKWTPYIGAGIGWVQEIDLDWELGNMEDSYSGDGQSAFQLFAGTQYEWRENWSVQLEVRYGTISSVDLNNELTNTPLNGLDYKTTSVQLGIMYNF